MQADPSPTLRAAQRLAIQSLLAGHRRAEVARHAGVSERTLRRWHHNPAFLTALRRFRSQAWREIESRLQAPRRGEVDILRALQCDLPSAAIATGRTLRKFQFEAVEQACQARLRAAEDRLQPGEEEGPPHPSTPSGGTRADRGFRAAFTRLREWWVDRSGQKRTKADMDGRGWGEKGGEGDRTRQKRTEARWITILLARLGGCAPGQSHPPDAVGPG